jgi:DNA invertase Pin-like site-specific DNA recombinase
MTTPAVLYAAKSTEDKNLSIPEQLDDAREMAEENGWQVVGEFSDEDFSAYSGNRGPDLEAAKQRAIEAAQKAGTPAMLVAQAHDRFARGAGDQPGAPQSLGELWHEMRRVNVHLRTVEDDEEMRDEASVAAIGRRAYIDSRRKSKSVKKGLRRRAEKGKLCGGPRPYGLRWIGPVGEKVLDVVPAEAEVVKRIFEDTVNGVSQRALTRLLNQEGIPTVTGVPWGQASVGRILRNPLYKGMVRNAGEVYPGAHEAIIAADLWDRAAAIRSSQARKVGGRWPKGSHLFTGGLLRCKCGSAMLPRTDPRPRKNVLAGGHPPHDAHTSTAVSQPTYQVYQCAGRLAHGLDFCDQPVIDRALVDEAMMDELNKRYLDVAETRRRLEAKFAADTVIAAATLVDADSEAQRAEARIARVQRAFQDGHIEAEDYAQQRAQLLEERDAAQAAADRAREHAAHLATAPAMADAEEAVLRHLANLRQAVIEGVSRAPDLNSLRTILRQLFEEVALLPADHPWLAHEVIRESSANLSGYVLLPVLRDSTVIEYDDHDVATIRRAVLPLETEDDPLPT